MGPLLRDAGQGADTLVWLGSAPEPATHPGAFWHDRAPRPTHRVPWTRENDDARRRLWDECVRRHRRRPGGAEPRAGDAGLGPERLSDRARAQPARPGAAASAPSSTCARLSRARIRSRVAASPRRAIPRP